MIWTFKIELLYGAYAKEECVRVIEIDSSSTLEHFTVTTHPLSSILAVFGICKFHLLAQSA